MEYVNARIHISAATALGTGGEALSALGRLYLKKALVVII